MIFKEHQGIKWLEFELLADCPIVHGCFMRHGGQSENHLASLNLGRGVNDDPENVKANWQKVREALEVNEMLSAKICHGDTISEISSLGQEIPISDGIATTMPNLALMITQADCQAAIFYDPINHAISNVHCGWRGSVKNIYSEAIKHMQITHGSNPADLLVALSPSLGPENAEFINYQIELPECFWDFQVKPEHFDFWSISEWQLKEAGVLGHHIQIAGIDTFKNVEDYFSFRRSRHCGRQATVCALKNKSV